MWYFAGIPIIPANQAWFPALFFFLCLAFIFMLMRMYSRIFLTRIVGWDDWLMMVAMVLSIVYIVSIIQQIKLGLGDSVAPEHVAKFTQWVFVTIIVYCWNQWIIKMSIVAQYYRVFPTRGPRNILKWIILWLGIYGVVNCITPFFMCTPVKRFWDRSIPGTCINYNVMHYVFSSINVANDFLILTFPIPILLKLKLPLRVRIILIITFACGLFASIVSIMRFQALVIYASGSPEQGPKLDVQISIWTSLEMNVAIICGSVSGVKPLFALFIPHLDVLSSSANTGTPKYNNKTHTRKSWVQLDDLNERTVTTQTANRDIEPGMADGVWVEQSIEISSSVIPNSPSERNLISNKKEEG